jgi:hypothetical protein
MTTEKYFSLTMPAKSVKKRWKKKKFRSTESGAGKKPKTRMNPGRREANISSSFF